jgi:hypothetical protein
MERIGYSLCFSGFSAKSGREGVPGRVPAWGDRFSLNFCPFSAVLFVVRFIPLVIGASDPVIIPAVFALATGLPVIVISYLLVQGMG